ncbi:MAG: hypothetical protein ACKVI4_15445 [Actinomycetales bacterium]
MEWLSDVSWVAWFTVVVCPLTCTFCMMMVAVMVQLLRDTRVAMRAFEERLQDAVYQGGLDPGAAREAAAWGAEVLRDVARGVRPDVAVQRSAARMRVDGPTGRLGPVRGRGHGYGHGQGYGYGDATSEAGSEPELHGLHDPPGGGDWIVRAARSVGTTPTHDDPYRCVLGGQEGARSQELHRRASVSPPRAREVLASG